MRAWLAVLSVSLTGCPVVIPLVDAGTPVPNHCAPTPADVPFGAVGAFTRLDQVITVRNPTADTVIVELGGVELPFSSSLEGRFKLGARQSQAVTFTVAPTDTLSHIARVSFRGGLECPTETFLLTAESRGGVTVSPRVLDFGALPLGGTRTLELVLVNSTDAPALITRAKPEPTAVFMPGVVPLEVPARGSAVLRLEARPTSAGFTRGTLDLGGPDFAELLQLSVHGGVPVAQLLPSTLDAGLVPVFSEVPAASFVERRVLLRNDAPVGSSVPANLELLAPAVTVEALEGTLAELCVGTWSETGCAALSAGSMSLPRGASLEIPLRIMPTTEGPRRWVVTFNTNAPLEPRPRLIISASAARPPECALTVTPPTLDLGVHPVGELSWAAVAFENVGQASCVLDAVRLGSGAGPDAGIDGGFLPVQPILVWLDGGVEQLTLAPAARHVATVFAVGRVPSTETGVVEYHVLQADAGVARVPFQLTVQ